MGLANSQLKPKDISMKKLSELEYVSGNLNDDNGHERDAVLAALSAFAQYKKPGGWKNLFNEDDTNLFIPFDYKVGYWMPMNVK